MKRKQEEAKPDTKNLILRGGMWSVNALVNGVRIRKALHTPDLREAQARRDAIIAPLRTCGDEKRMLSSVRRQLTGISVEEERKKAEEDKGIPLAKAWERFVHDPTRRACGESQTVQHRRNWGGFLTWMQTHYSDVTRVKQVTREMCAEWASWMMQTKRAVNTYNKHICSVHFVFESVCAVDDTFLNPMRGISKRNDKGDCVSKEPFSDEELRNIFGSLDDEFVRLCAVGLYTTLRFSSARRLTWEMFDENLEYLKAIHDKTGADASQRVAAELREVLERVPVTSRNGFVCPMYATQSEANASKDMMQHLQDVGIQTHREVTGINGTPRRACVKGFHSFRHTAITLALRNGATVSQVKRLAGHASEKMQERYTHLGADDAGKASAVIGKFW